MGPLGCCAPTSHETHLLCQKIEQIGVHLIGKTLQNLVSMHLKGACIDFLSILVHREGVGPMGDEGEGLHWWNAGQWRLSLPQLDSRHSERPDVCTGVVTV